MIELNRENYEAEIQQTGLPMLIDFWGPQCQPCLALNPVVEELEKIYEDRLKVAKVNSSQNRMLCAKLRVIGLPSFLLYKGGAEVKRLTGENIKKDDLVAAIEAVLA